MWHVILLCVSFIFLPNVNSLPAAKFIVDYTTENNLQLIVMYSCFVSKTAQMSYYKNIMSYGLRIVIFNNRMLSEGNQFLFTATNSIAVIADADCNGVRELLLKLDGSLFCERYNWLITSTKSDVFKFLENMDLNINSEVTVALLKNDTWNAFEVYNQAAKHEGILSISKRLHMQDKKSKYIRRKNMTGVHFKTFIVLPAGFEGTLTDYLSHDGKRYSNTFNRFNYCMLEHCREFYNYSINIALTDSWGYMLKNGSFDGIVGALQRGDIDFGSSPLFFRYDRSNIIQYGRVTWRLKSAFLFRDRKKKASVKTFFRPLDSDVWICTFISAACLIVLLRVAFKIERIINNRNENSSSWMFIIVTTVGTFCQQGSLQNSSMLSGRIVIIFTLVLSMLIYQFYSASIVSFLLMKPTTTIKTLKDILHSGMKVGCEDILYIRDFLMHSTDETARELYTKHILKRDNKSNFYPAEVGLSFVEKGNYAFDVETATAYPIIQKSFSDNAICELREVQLLDRPMHFVLQKNSPFKDMFDTCLHRLAEHGLLYRQIHHWHPKKPECITSSNSFKAFNIGMGEAYPAFILLITGAVASLFILVIENILMILKKRRNRHSPIKPFVN